MNLSARHYKQYTDKVEHKYTNATVFINNYKKTEKKPTWNNTSATLFDICQMTNRTGVY